MILPDIYVFVVFSTDADFSRFPGLKWRNPFAP